MIRIPLAVLKSQTLQVQLDGQTIQLAVYQKSTGLFTDVYLANALLVGGVIGRNLNRIVRDAYFGLAGDLTWFDTAGLSDPVWTGLGVRFQLLYLTASELGGRG